jgi:hypothetical protein
VSLSRLSRYELVGLLSAAMLLLSLFLPWYELGGSAAIREQNDYWVCGTGEFTCDAWSTFPILRWLLVAAAVAPVLLTYFILREEEGKYPTGEFTMTVGFAVIVLVAFNGLLDKPGSSIEQFGIGLEWGYFVALLAGILMAGAGALRSLESGGGAPKKPPGTF